MYQGPIRHEYYGAPPPGYYPPLPPPIHKEEVAASGAPWWIWLGAGLILSQVLSKVRGVGFVKISYNKWTEPPVSITAQVQEYMKNPKTPQQMMAEMAMKQMMGAMGNNPGGAR
jgi:hypothetical protein